MVIEKDADEAFDRWYMDLDNYTPSKDLETFYERKHDHVLTTAMILSAAESDEMIITLNHLEQALAAVQHVEDNISAAVSHIGATHQANTADFMEAMIRSVYPESMSHSVLLRRMYKRLSYGASEFKELVGMLEDQGKIKPTESVKGTVYTAIIHKKGRKK